MMQPYASPLPNEEEKLGEHFTKGPVNSIQYGLAMKMVSAS